ncbi:hypothetical protein VKT23_020125 [Stygiomarasmius scandens]|uniref:Uncharacterized protein n=1 Tax=Marasmiellus scandens TaxID=2682957 RepID=A0ABR1INV9_9AGAR
MQSKFFIISLDNDFQGTQTHKLHPAKHIYSSKVSLLILGIIIFQQLSLEIQAGNLLSTKPIRAIISLHDAKGAAIRKKRAQWKRGAGATCEWDINLSIDASTDDHTISITFQQRKLFIFRKTLGKVEFQLEKFFQASTSEISDQFMALTVKFIKNVKDAGTQMVKNTAPPLETMIAHKALELFSSFEPYREIISKIAEVTTKYHSGA